MTIRRGEPWGVPGPLPGDAVIVRSDAEARHVLSAAHREGRPLPVLGLLGGDLCRTVGGRGDEARLHTPEAVHLPIDLGIARLDGVDHVFCAHLVARRGWWHGPLLAVMNAQFLGAWDVAPRSHPDDGRLDVLDVDPRLGVRARWQASRRLPSGGHVPHPLIGERRVTDWSVTFERPLRVRLDGDDVGVATEIAVRVEPDALTVVV